MIGLLLKEHHLLEVKESNESNEEAPYLRQHQEKKKNEDSRSFNISPFKS
jgi:hypothetical protein